jgi:amino acid adenylation domain-containing protein
MQDVQLNSTIERQPKVSDGVLSDHRLLDVERNDSAADHPQGVCIHDLFAAQVARTPDAPAVVFEGRQLTYRELNTRANQLAHYLGARGVGPEVLVGIYLNRSLEMVVGLLGVLKAGGAYVPLDPYFPRERLAYMLQDAAAPVLLTEQWLAADFPAYAGSIVCMDRDWQVVARESTAMPATAMSPDNLAYVIYTSGSTGKPKGVEIPHGAMVNLLNSMRQEPGFDAHDIMLALTTLSFDIAALEIFLPLVVGARVVIVTRETAIDGGLLSEAIIGSGATCVQATPATWRMLLHSGWKGNGQLRIFCGGEALPRALANSLIGKSQVLWNLYGPTETTIYSTLQRVVANSGPVSIGRPIANTDVYLLDGRLRPVAPGEPGELCIGGWGLARGYRNRPDLTGEKFVPNPFRDEPGARMYRTGDLARRLPDGTLECLGRLDHQVKIRGFRIELGEIEARLMSHPAVREAVVTASANSHGEQRLVAYVIANGETVPSNRELTEFLKQHLPDYMIPTAFGFLDAFLLTPNGKVDRKALPALQGVRPALEEDFVPPRTPVEAQLQKIWEELLEIQPVGMRDGFFELGGDSLTAVRLVMKIREMFGKNLPMAVLIEKPTIEDLAQLLQDPGEFSSRSVLVPIQPHGSKPALVFVHGIGGALVVCVRLGQYLAPHYPFYAFRARGLEGDGEPFTAIGPMATYYVEELLRFQPQGPYLLGGWSFGALVAFEMAGQLLARGHRVEFLAILDQPAPNPQGAIGRNLSLVPNFLRNFLFLLKTDKAFRRSWPGQIPVLLHAVVRATGRKGIRLLNRLRGRKPAPVNWEKQAGIEKLTEDHHAVFRAHLRAARSYQRQACPVRITLFRHHIDLLADGYPPDMGWRKLAQTGVDVRPVSGQHDTILTEPHVQIVAKQLMACIDQIEGAKT